MNYVLTGIRKPVAVGAIALLVLAGSAGLASLAFAQEEGSASPTVEDQVTPDAAEPTAVDEGTAEDGTTDDGTSGEDGSVDDEPKDGSSEDRSGKPECDEDKPADDPDENVETTAF